MTTSLSIAPSATTTPDVTAMLAGLGLPAAATETWRAAEWRALAESLLQIVASPAAPKPRRRRAKAPAPDAAEPTTMAAPASEPVAPAAAAPVAPPEPVVPAPAAAAPVLPATLPTPRPLSRKARTCAGQSRRVVVAVDVGRASGPWCMTWRVHAKDPDTAALTHARDYAIGAWCRDQAQRRGLSPQAPYGWLAPDRHGLRPEWRALADDALAAGRIGLKLVGADELAHIHAHRAAQGRDPDFRAAPAPLPPAETKRHQRLFDAVTTLYADPFLAQIEGPYSPLDETYRCYLASRARRLADAVEIFASIANDALDPDGAIDIGRAQDDAAAAARDNRFMDAPQAARDYRQRQRLAQLRGAADLRRAA